MAQPISVQLVPLISVAVGAIIALAGGWLKDWLNRREKRKHLKREKLELLCSNVCGLRPWTDVLESTLAFGVSNEQAASPFEEIEVLTRLYFPELESNLRTLLTAARKYKAAMLTLSSKRMQSGRPAPEAGDVIHQLYLPLSGAIDAFVTAAQGVAKDLD